MHIYFSGIGGAAIGPLALIAKQAGYDVSGSDASDSSYIDYLKKHGIADISIGQTSAQIADAHARKPIDWLVYSSALPRTNPDHPELIFAKENGIKSSRRDELLNKIIEDKKLKLLAVAGTHGKTTTTAMTVWVFKQLGTPVSYSVGAKLPFGEMGEFDPASRYFIYEADEYDRNFLSFYPAVSMITGIDWDHPDIYPSRESYLAAFNEFLDQSQQAVLWHDDAEQLNLEAGHDHQILEKQNPEVETVKLAGLVNRQDAWLVANALSPVLKIERTKILDMLNKFPGLSRRFEQIAPHIYSDYAHTPPKIRGALQLAHEVAGDNIVVIYEGLHNTRQHFIKDELAGLFKDVRELYVVPSYLAREDESLKLLSPQDLILFLDKDVQAKAHSAELDSQLADVIKEQAAKGNLVLALSAGGAGSLDEWLRKEF